MLASPNWLTLNFFCWWTQLKINFRCVTASVLRHASGQHFENPYLKSLVVRLCRSQCPSIRESAALPVGSAQDVILYYIMLERELRLSWTFTDSCIVMLKCWGDLILCCRVTVCIERINPGTRTVFSLDHLEWNLSFDVSLCQSWHSLRQRVNLQSRKM